MTSTAGTDRDVLATLTAVRDLCARAGNAQIVAALHVAMSEISSLRAQLEQCQARYRLVEGMALRGRGMTR